MMLLQIILIQRQKYLMMNKLRGRSLAHPGCLIGITTGLILGIALAAVLALVNVAFPIDLLVWLGLTVGLGALGWLIGSALTARFPASEEAQASVDPNLSELASAKEGNNG